MTSFKHLSCLQKELRVAIFVSQFTNLISSIRDPSYKVLSGSTPTRVTYKIKDAGTFSKVVELSEVLQEVQ